MNNNQNETNPSFIKLHERLRSEGVFNIRLVTKYLKLLNVSPYDPNLTDETKQTIMTTIMDDLWYFAREVVRIPTPNGNAKFRINEANFIAMKLLCLNIDVYSNNPRNTDTTTSACCYYLWKILRYSLITRSTKIEEFPPYKLTILTPDAESHRYIVNRLKEMNELLPDYIKVTNDLINEVIKPYANLSNVNVAELTGRGLITGDLYISDFEHIDYIDRVMHQITTERLFGNDAPRIWVTSTIGSYDSNSKKAADKLIMNSAIKWHNRFFDLELEFLENKFVYVNIPFERLVDEPELWFEQMSKDLDQDAISRELLMVR